MEAQMHRPHSVPEGAGEVEHHHEKKSVLKKVKAKAKKIKESIKHLGHDHQDDDDEDDEYDDDEEMVDDPEVHGAPIYESTPIRSGVVLNQDIGMPPKSGVNLGEQSSRREDPLDSNVTIEDKMRQFVHSTGDGRETNDDIPAEHKSNEPRASGNSSLTHHHGGLERTEREPGARFGVLTTLQQDPQAPTDKPNPSNYQSKLTDPTGQRAEEAGVPPLVASFGKMTVDDETEAKSSAKATEEKNLYSGSHDQFSPEATECGPESIPQQFDSGKPEDDMPRDTIDGKSPGGDGSRSYADKISSAATVLVDKATMAKNVVASKMGYGDEKGTRTSSTDSAAMKSSSYSPTEYAHKAAAAVTETLAPIYGKVAGVGSAVVCKVPGISTDQKGFTESCTESSKSRVTMKEYLVEKLKPGEEDRALSEVILDSLQMQKGGRKPIGRVTESEEVARRLGSGQENRREGSDAVNAGRESTGNNNGVVNQMKDAVCSWVLKASESPTSHQGSHAAESRTSNIFCDRENTEDSKSM